MNDNKNPFQKFDYDKGANNQNLFDDESDLNNQNVNLNNNMKPLNDQIKSENNPSANENKPSNQGAPSVAEQISNNTMTQINTSLNFISRYFNVEIKDVLDRLKGAVIPFNKSFYQTAEKNPDLYGPLWIYTTIIFVITIASNISGYLGVSNY